jgi:putative aldouronate transport system permease protein
MIEKNTPSRIIFNILNYAFMILFSIVCIAPIWHVIMCSISDPAELVKNTGLLLKPLTILFRVLMPLVKANIAVVVLFTVVAQWNSWYPASIYLPRVREYWPLQLFMREVLIQNSDAVATLNASTVAGEMDFTNRLVKYCLIVVGTFPILCAYPFAQKYFVKGATLGGVKG